MVVDLEFNKSCWFRDKEEERQFIKKLKTLLEKIDEKESKAVA